MVAGSFYTIVIRDTVTACRLTRVTGAVDTYSITRVTGVVDVTGYYT